MKEKYFNILILLIIIFVGTGLRIHYGNQKVYFHHDEIFSLEASNGNTWAYERTNEENWNKVISGNIFKKDVEISHDEQFNFDFLKIEGESENGTHPPLHYISLHLFQTLLTDGKFSKWPGIVLNIVFYVFSSVALYLISSLFINDKFLLFLPTFIFATHNLMISMSMFSRMYEMMTTFSLLSLYFNMKFLLDKDKKNERKNLIFLSISCIFAGLSHYYFLVLMFVTFLITALYLIKNKEVKKLGRYVAVLSVTGVLYVLIWPHFFRQVFIGAHGLFVNKN